MCVGSCLQLIVCVCVFNFVCGGGWGCGFLCVCGSVSLVVCVLSCMCGGVSEMCKWGCALVVRVWHVFKLCVGVSKLCVWGVSKLCVE